MFNVGEYIVYGRNGVCKVVSIMKSPVNPDDNRDFYELKPLARESGVIYTPVDNTQVLSRLLISKEEAKKLLESVPTLEILDVASEKTRRETYRLAMEDLSAEGFARVIKTVSERRKTLSLLKKNLTETDINNDRLARMCLFYELSVILGADYSEIEDLFFSYLEK